MIVMETAMKIRRLVHVSGRSIRSVSRETGLSRNTIRKYLHDESPPRYQLKAAKFPHHKDLATFDPRFSIRNLAMTGN